MFRSIRRAWREHCLARRILPLNKPPLFASPNCASPTSQQKSEPQPLTRMAFNAPPVRPLNILAVGVYLADRVNTAASIIAEFERCAPHRVEQRWIGLALSNAEPALLPHTQRMVKGRAPRFTLLNELIGDPSPFDWIIICDDDVEFPPHFIEDFFSLAEHFDFSLCQPARTPDSFYDLHMMRQAPGLLARRTRFVEIGPAVCIRADSFGLVLPFAEGADMGWGHDFIWAAKLEKAGLNIGVIDAAPMAHRIRPTVSTYGRSEAEEAMNALLARTPHLTRAEALTVLDAYADA